MWTPRTDPRTDQIGCSPEFNWTCDKKRCNRQLESCKKTIAAMQDSRWNLAREAAKKGKVIYAKGTYYDPCEETFDGCEKNYQENCIFTFEPQRRAAKHRRRANQEHPPPPSRPSPHALGSFARVIAALHRKRTAPRPGPPQPAASNPLGPSGGVLGLYVGSPSSPRFLPRGLRGVGSRRPQCTRRPTTTMYFTPSPAPPPAVRSPPAPPLSPPPAPPLAPPPR